MYNIVKTITIMVCAATLHFCSIYTAEQSWIVAVLKAIAQNNADVRALEHQQKNRFEPGASLNNGVVEPQKLVQEALQRGKTHQKAFDEYRRKLKEYEAKERKSTPLFDAFRKASQMIPLFKAAAILFLPLPLIPQIPLHVPYTRYYIDCGAHIKAALMGCERTVHTVAKNIAELDGPPTPPTLGGVAIFIATQ